jgi:peroxiredoxin
MKELTRMTFRQIVGLVLIALLVIGCNRATPVPPTDAPTSTPLSENPTLAPNVDTTPAAQPTDDTAALPDATPTTLSGIVPAWLAYPITDARTGKPFTLGDYRGKTLYVGLFTTGCAACRTQFNNLKGAIAKLGRDQYGYVGMSAEPLLKNEDLARYANEAGFDWQFAVIPPELLAMWGLSFGRAATEPTNAAYFIVYPDGTLSRLYAGDVQSADDLAKAITAPK